MKRKTLPALIREQPTIEGKVCVASRGAPVSALQMLSQAWLALNDPSRRMAVVETQLLWIECKMPQYDKLSPKDKGRFIYQNILSHLSNELFRAILQRDGRAFRALADELERDPRKDDFPKDKLRLSVLFCRDALGEKPRWTLKKLAAATDYHGPLEHLRRVAKELGFPVLKDRIGAPKKGKLLANS